MSGGDGLGCAKVSRIEVSYQTHVIVIVHGCSSFHNCPHIVCWVQFQNLLGDNLMTACSCEKKSMQGMVDWNLTYRETASEIAWLWCIPVWTYVEMIYWRQLVLNCKNLNWRHSVTDQPPWSIHRGRACLPLLLYWRHWFGGRVKMWAETVLPSRCLYPGYRSPQSSNRNVTVHSPLHHILYHLLSTHMLSSGSF